MESSNRKSTGTSSQGTQPASLAAAAKHDASVMNERTGKAAGAAQESMSKAASAAQEGAHNVAGEMQGKNTEPMKMGDRISADAKAAAAQAQDAYRKARDEAGRMEKQTVEAARGSIESVEKKAMDAAAAAYAAAKDAGSYVGQKASDAGSYVGQKASEAASTAATSIKQAGVTAEHKAWEAAQAAYSGAMAAAGYVDYYAKKTAESALRGVSSVAASGADAVKPVTPKTGGSCAHESHAAGECPAASGAGKAASDMAQARDTSKSGSRDNK